MLRSENRIKGFYRRYEMRVLLKWFILVVGLSLFIYVFLYAQTDSMNEKSQQYEERGLAYLDQYEQSRNEDDLLKAIEEFEKWKEIDESEHVYYWLGEAYYRLRYFSKAEALLLKSLSINPDNLDTIDLLANVYVGHGKYKRAIEYFKKIKDALPEDEKTILNIATMQFHLGRYQDAIQTAHECLKLDPTMVEANRIIALAYRYLGDIEKSIQMCKKIENSYTFFDIIYADFALLYYDLGDYSQALSYAQEYYKRRFNIGYAHELLALIYKKLGEEQLMNEALQKAEKLYIEGKFYIALTRLYNNLNLNPRKTLLFASRAISYNKSFETYREFARAYYRNKKYKQSLEALTYANDINPNDSQTWYQLGMVHKSLGDIDSALQAFEKALTLGPKMYHEEIKEEIKKIKKK